VFEASPASQRLQPPIVVPEAGFGAQQSRTTQEDQVVPLTQIVADRRRAQQEQESLLELVDELERRVDHWLHFLHAGDARTTGDRQSERLRTLLVAGQIAMTR
jgi:hypothetical protein